MQQGFLSWLGSQLSELLSRLPLPDVLKTPVMFVAFIGVLASLAVFLYSLTLYLRARRAALEARGGELPPPKPPLPPEEAASVQPETAPSEVLPSELEAARARLEELLIGGGERPAAPLELDIDELSKRLNELKRELESIAEQPPTPEQPPELPPPPLVPSEPAARELESPAGGEKPPEAPGRLEEAKPEPVAEAPAEDELSRGISYVKAKIRALDAALGELEKLRDAGDVDDESYSSLRDEISSQIESLKRDLEAFERKRRLKELMRKRDEYAAKLREVEEEIRRLQSEV